MYTTSFNDTLRIAIFDKDQDSRNHLYELLTGTPGFNVVASHNETKNCIKNIIASRAHMVIMDIDISREKAISVINEIKKELPHVQILIQTGIEDGNHLYRSIVAGASGYVLKSQSNDSQLIKAIKELRYGGAPLSPSVSRQVVHMVRKLRVNSPANPDTNFDNNPLYGDYNLTLRERQIVKLIADGMNYKAACTELDISYETIRTHIKNIYGKLKINSLTQLVAVALSYHLA
jgi:DNA-binding NarL/FixJ family response regulator